MILSAQLFDSFDRCPRRFAFERSHSPLTISPLGLLYHAIESSLTAPDPLAGARDALSDKTSQLEITTSSDLSQISTLHHVRAMAEVISLALRNRFGKAARVDPIAFWPHQWHSNLFLLKSTLYRLILTSHIDDDSLRSFAHSWQTIGELAALERPISLLIVVIGSQRNGRRHSYWSKASQHPVQTSAIRFAPRKKDDEFTANWKTVWREQSNIAAETWLERMESDEVLGELISTRKIQYNAEDQRMIQAKRDMVTIAEEMDSASPDSPMRRSSCDELGRGACPFSACCYSPTPASPDDFPHLYLPSETPLVTLAG